MEASLVEEPDKPNGNGRAQLIQPLVRETGISETQAAELVTLLGAAQPISPEEASALPSPLPPNGGDSGADLL
jgi:hypothetical protein